VTMHPILQVYRLDLVSRLKADRQCNQIK